MDPFYKAIPYNEFKSCLNTWLKDTSIGAAYLTDIKFDEKADQIVGWM